jgi:hypothetical protein
MPSFSGSAMSPHLNSDKEKSTSLERRDAVGSSKSLSDQKYGPRTVESLTDNNSSFNAYAKLNSQLHFERPYMQFSSANKFPSGSLVSGMNVGQHPSVPSAQFKISDDSIRELCMLEKELFEYDPSSGYTDGIIHAASEAYRASYKLSKHHHEMHLVYLQEADNILMQYQMDKKTEQDRMLVPPSMTMDSLQHQTTFPMGTANALNYSLNSSFVNVPRHFIMQMENVSNTVMNSAAGMPQSLLPNNGIATKRPLRNVVGNTTHNPGDSSQKKPRHSSPRAKVPSHHNEIDTTVSPSDSEKSVNETSNIAAELSQNQSEIDEGKHIGSEDDADTSEESLNSTEENTAHTMVKQFGFDHFYQELCRYYDEHGHLNVPKKLKLRTNPLYLFIHEVQQVALKKANRKDDEAVSDFLNDERMSLLKSIGFPFLNSEGATTTEVVNSYSSSSNREKIPDDVEFMEFYKQLTDFHNHFGHFDLVKLTEDKYVKLANYMTDLRKQYFKMRDDISSGKSDGSDLPVEFRERVKKLKAIGFL